MPNLSVKDVPDALAERLRQRAAQNHRSLQGELMAIIEQAVREPSGRVHSVAVDRNGRAGVRRGTKSSEQIAAEHRARFPRPIAAGPSAADIVRADRDAR